MTPEDAWREQGRQLGRHQHHADYELGWEIGDWWLRAPDAWRKRVETEQWESPSAAVAKAAAVCCRKFTGVRRLKDIAFTFFRQAAKLDPDDADELLKRVRVEGLTSRQFDFEVRRRQMLRRNGKVEGGTVTDLTALAQSGKKFGTILADVPWDFKWDTAHGGSYRHYPSMKLPAVQALPVPGLAADICHLHVWCPSAMLDVGIDLIRHWGFEYKSNLIWVKPRVRPGLGYHYRLCHEHLLLGVRGYTGGFMDRTIPSVIEAPVGRHSEKPEEVRKLIERASPAPRIELFARRQVEGWVTWGDEVPPPDIGFGPYEPED